MPRESKQTIVFVVPGERHEAGATRGAGVGGELAVPGLDGQVIDAVRVGQRRDGGAGHRLEAVVGEDVVEIGRASCRERV